MFNISFYLLCVIWFISDGLCIVLCPLFLVNIKLKHELCDKNV